MSTAFYSESADSVINIDAVPKTEAEFVELCKNPAWRINNLYQIKDKHGDKIMFRLNAEQWRFYREMHTRNIILKARQLGFTTFMQIYMLDQCMFSPNTNAGVVAHNRDDASAFFKDKIQFAYNNLPDFLKKMHPATNESAGELRFENGSVIRVGTSLRSGTLQILHVSEYGKLCAKFPDRAMEVRTGTLPTVPADGIVVIESTAEGRHGDFFHKAEKARTMKEEMVELTDLDYKFHFFAWWENPEYELDAIVNRTSEDDAYFERLEKRGIELNEQKKSWYIKTRAEIDSDTTTSMKSEFPSYPEEAFEASVEGAYFARAMEHVRAKGQITNVPFEHHLPVDVYFDLGLDGTAMWFVQEIGFDLRFIDYYENAGEQLNHYITILKTRSDGNYPYNYGTLYLPHDGDRKSLQNKHSIGRAFNDNGFSVAIIPRTPSKDMAIEKARQVLPHCWFDATRCREGISRMDAYRREWNEKLSVWKTTPVHDINSHTADAFMTFSDSYRGRSGNQSYRREDERPVTGRNPTTGY